MDKYFNVIYKRKTLFSNIDIWVSLSELTSVIPKNLYSNRPKRKIENDLKHNEESTTRALKIYAFISYASAEHQNFNSGFAWPALLRGYRIPMTKTKL